MAPSSDSLVPASRATGSAFRRVGATVAVACVLTGSIMGLGAMGALATPGSSSAPVTASDERTPTEEVFDPATKVTYTEADLAAFAASPYAGDALNLAAIWATTPEWAQGKAGAKIQAGIPLPYAPGESSTIEYTTDQKLLALQTESDFLEALRLASVWGTDDLVSAKAELGGLLLAHEPLPTAPTEYTDDQRIHAFGLWGYTDADAVQLAGLWQTDTHSAIVRAGGELLAGNYLPL
jgi:hypothetical protein